MAQFDVYATSGKTLLLDCQTDFLLIDTRLVVPLRPRSETLNLVRRLNPILVVEGDEFAMMTQTMAAVRAVTLGTRIASLANEQDNIKAAIDMLIVGY